MNCIFFNSDNVDKVDSFSSSYNIHTDKLSTHVLTKPLMNTNIFISESLQYEHYM
mgnify:CR=1 FL=1